LPDIHVLLVTVTVSTKLNLN